MSKGDRSRMQKTQRPDSKTGRAVWKLTGWEDANCVATYMYSQALSADERYLFFASDRTGTWQIYRLEMESGETVQISDATPVTPEEKAGIIVWCSVHPKLQELFYCTSSAIFAVNVATLDERRVAESDAARAVLASPMASFMADGRHLIAPCRLPDGHPGIALADVRGGPLEVVMRWPDKEGFIDHVLGGRRGPFDGAQGRPEHGRTGGNRLVISFAPGPDRQNHPELPPEKRARTWQLDPASGKTAPFLVMPPGFRATHETWAAPDKIRLFYHKKTVPGWTPASIESMNGDGSDRRVHFHSDRMLGHSCVSPDGLWLVSDVQDPAGNELFLVSLLTGESQVLCWPNSSVANGQSGHVHPFFSPSGRHVVFTSDAGGKAAVYMVGCRD